MSLIIKKNSQKKLSLVQIHNLSLLIEMFYGTSQK